MKTNLLVVIKDKNGTAYYERSNKKGKIGIKINLYESGPLSTFFINPKPVLYEKVHKKNRHKGK